MVRQEWTYSRSLPPDRPLRAECPSPPGREHRGRCSEDIPLNPVNRYGLVLGGGGPVGAAWYAGLASGLADEGVDLGLATVIIGTSAGAWAGAWLASDKP